MWSKQVKLFPQNSCTTILRVRAANEPNVRRTVREPFGGKFVYVRLFIKQTNTNKKFRSFS
ncbi:hypothetical protein HanRHA438_Chr03g0121211 [Helianthus annuus]|nr:hypothetical protein HanIR_Chr03g0120501 [Helianthus annuus]KAJ0935577.1 hypothetical protein HanRHA438_Chr03g0121211 [Helianthus annuus]